MIKSLILSALLSFAIGCQTTSRVPASLPRQLEAEALTVYHQQNNLNLMEAREVQVAKDQKSNTLLLSVHDRLANEEQSLEQAKTLLGSRSSNTIPEVGKISYNTPWRYQSEELEVSDLKSFEFKGAEPTRVFYMGIQDTRAFDLKLKQIVTVQKENLVGEVSCDTDFELSNGSAIQAYAPNSLAQFSWPNISQRAQLLLRLKNQNAHCSLKYKQVSSTVWSGQKLVPEAEQFGDLLRVTHEFQACSLPQTNYLQPGVEKFFLSNSYSSMSCPESAPIQLSGRPIEGLTERIKLLTGGFELPQSVIDARDPFVDLDFSKAPKFDVIVVSSLVFRSDFYGRLLARALLWHAQHGTVVRILNSKVLELKKDRAMFREMMNASDNVKVQSYSFQSATNGLGSRIEKLHRVSHTKIFAAYSRSNPSASVVIVGGRNIHEGYILPLAVDHFKLPLLVNYYGGEDNYLFYRDLEAVIHSPQYVETVMSHFLTFWSREPNNYIRSFSLNFPSTSQIDTNYFNSKTPLLRHVLSLPYEDDQELMDVYADLIDSAQHELKITSPYFVPTKRVAQALERAAQRGVAITVITKLDLTGDNPDLDFLSTAANKIAVNKYWDMFKIYDYAVTNSVLHSKLMLVDGKLSVIGSVNLNRRSFYHDVENATIVYSPEFNSELSAYYSEFISKSALVTGEKRIGFFKRVLVEIVKNEL